MKEGIEHSSVSHDEKSLLIGRGAYSDTIGTSGRATEKSEPDISMHEGSDTITPKKILQTFREDPRYFSPKRTDREIHKAASDIQLESLISKENAATPGKKSIYPMYDAPLDSPEDDFDPDAFQGDFARFAIKEGEEVADLPSLKEYIEARKQPHAGRAVGLELGGPGSNLFNSFDEGFFRKTIGLTLRDLRSDEQKARDTARNHHVIEGDMQSDEAIAAVDNALDGDKVDVLFQRAGGGLLTVRPDPYHIADMTNTWYQRLSDEDGIFFSQVPSIVEPLLDSWEAKLRESGDAVQLRIDAESVAWHNLELTKHSGAPEHLPFLDARAVRSLYEQHRWGKDA